MNEEPILYFDKRDCRLLDLRPEGITCITAIGMSNFASVRKDAEFHYHPHAVEICLCLRGNLTFETETTDYKFLPGTIFVSTPRQPHRLKNNPKGLKLYRLLFKIPRRGMTFLGLNARESEWLSRSLQNLPKRSFSSIPRVRSGFERIFDLYDHARHSPARHARMKSAVLDLLISVIDAARRLPNKIPDTILSLASQIRENPEKDYTISETAGKLGLSRSAFSDLFKKSLGLPLHAYVINARILSAQKLLESTAKPISEIAHELNFATMPHFITTFKRIVGITPFALRQAHTDKQRHERT